MSPEMMEIEMKTMIAALALVLLVIGPTFAAGSHAKHHLKEGRASVYVPQSSGYDGSDYAPSSREQMIHNTN